MSQFTLLCQARSWVTYCNVGHKDGISYKGKRVAFVGSLRPIAKGENETCEQEAYIGILEDSVENLDRLATDDGRVLEGIGQDEERDKEITLEHMQTRQVSVRTRFLLTTWDPPGQTKTR